MNLITLCSRICPDGLGDFYALVKTARLLQDKFRVHLIAAVPHEFHPQYDKSQRLVIHDQQKIPTDWIPYEYDQLMGCYAYFPINIPTSVQNILAQSSHILQIPVPFIDALNDPALLKHSINVYEYGYHSSTTSKIRELSLGLAKDHLGIFICASPQEFSVQDLQNAALKHLLSETLGKNSANATFHLAYLKNPHFRKLYFNMIVSMSKQKKQIDICIPVNSFDDLEINHDWISANNIGQVSLITPTREETIVLKTAKKNARKIRLINLFPFVAEDFHKLQALSAQPVGCTGDQSLSELISADQPFFYEIMSHKDPFYQDMIDYALSVIPNHHSPFIEYLKTIQKFNEMPDEQKSQEIAAIAQELQRQTNSSDFLIDYREFVRRIKLEKSFDPVRMIEEYPT